MSYIYQGPAALVLVQNAQDGDPEQIARANVDVTLSETMAGLFRVSTLAEVPALANTDRVRVTLPDGTTRAGYVTSRSLGALLFRRGEKPTEYVDGYPRQ